MSKLLHIGLGAAGVLGVAYVAHRIISRDEDREGVNGWASYSGCNHFEIFDQEQLEQYLSKDPKELAPMREAINDGEPLESVLLLFFEAMFPRCEWPPPSHATFGKAKVSWPRAIASAREKEAAQGEPADTTHYGRILRMMRNLNGA